MRKEYNDRWNSPLVNPPITEDEYQANKGQKAKCGNKNCKGLFIDADSFQVAKCDACQVFPTDKSAAIFVHKMVQNVA